MNREKAEQALKDIVTLAEMVKAIQGMYEFTSDPIHYHRGMVKDDVAAALGMQKNPRFWRLVDEAAKRVGFQPVHVNGSRMYKHCKKR